MTTSITAYTIQSLFLVWAAVWLAAAWRNKTARQKEPLWSRLRYQAVTTLGLILMFAGLPDIEHADSDLFVRGPVLNVTTITLVALGLFWAIWARIHLGRNWSGTVQLKQDHQLVRSGPYRLTRHPIYTGLLLAFAALAAFLDRWLELPGFALIVVGFRMKLAREERFLEQAFGDEYTTYRRQVGMLVPFLW
jgi:protein-S-isoprenylcysteine O-methyltransferase Ste14